MVNIPSGKYFSSRFRYKERTQTSRGEKTTVGKVAVDFIGYCAMFLRQVTWRRLHDHHTGQGRLAPSFAGSQTGTFQKGCMGRKDWQVRDRPCSARRGPWRRRRFLSLLMKDFARHFFIAVQTDLVELYDCVTSHVLIPNLRWWDHESWGHGCN